MNAQHRSAGWALVAAVAAACATSPPVAEPPAAATMPAAFPSAGRGDANATVKLDWWTTFGEPSLDALVLQGLTHNHDLQATAARLAAAAAARGVAAGSAWPELDGNLDAQRARRLFLGFPFGTGGVPSSTTTTFGLSLAVRWELDVWGRVRAGESAAIADVEAARADVAAAQISLAGQICRAWFALREATQQLELAQRTVTAFADTADDVRDRYRRGVRPAFDVHVAATNLANARATAAQRAEQLQRARTQLDVLVGRWPGAGEGLPGAPGDEPPAIPGALPSELLHRRPDLVAAERRLAAAGCRVDQARAGLWPRLSLTASGGTASEELGDLVDEDFRIWSVGANLLAPLFRGGALRAEVAGREARAAEAAAAYGGAVLRAFAEVEDVLATEQHLGERRLHAVDAERHAAAAAELARARYRAGVADFLAVADSQRQAFLAESARLAIDRLRRDNRIDLFLALGGGFDRSPPGDQP